MVSEFRIIWGTPGGGGVSTLYSSDDTQPEAQVTATAIKTWLGQLAMGLSDQVNANLDAEVRSLDVTTGTLTSVFTIVPGGLVTGGNALQPVADASQILIRWNTGEIVNGRRLAGRTFVPGLPASSLVGGNINPASAADFAADSQAMIDSLAPNGLVIWHRPVNGAGGQQVQMVGASVWSEMAVLRRRRS